MKLKNQGLGKLLEKRLFDENSTGCGYFSIKGTTGCSIVSELSMARETRSSLLRKTKRKPAVTMYIQQALALFKISNQARCQNMAYGFSRKRKALAFYEGLLFMKLTHLKTVNF